MSLSTVYRWIETLRQADFIVRHPRTRRLHLGTVAFELGVQAVTRPYVHPDVEDILTPIAYQHHCRLHIVLRSGDYSVLQRTYFDTCEMEIVRSKVAAMRLIGIGPGGVCLLAQWPDYEIDRYLMRNESGLLAAGFTAEDIRQRAQECRTQGYFVTQSVLTPGFTAVAVGFELEGAAYGVSAALEGSYPSEKTMAVLESLKLARQALQSLQVPVRS